MLSVIRSFSHCGKLREPQEGAVTASFTPSLERIHCTVHYGPQTTEADFSRSKYDLWNLSHVSLCEPYPSFSIQPVLTTTSFSYNTDRFD